MSTPSMSPHVFRTRAKRKPLNYNLMVTVLVHVITWIFAAGMLWQKVNDLEKSVVDLRTEVRQHWNGTAHATSQLTAEPGSQ
jgi:hypothetical protein